MELGSVVGVRLINRYGEFAVDLGDRSTVAFKVKGMREATAWVVAIKDRLEACPTYCPSSERGDSPPPQPLAPSGEEEWPSDEHSSVGTEAAPSAEPSEKGQCVLGGPAIFEPKRWAEVEPALWWRNDETRTDGGSAISPTEGAVVDPLGLAPDDVLEGLCRQRPELRLTDQHFDPKEYLATVHVSANFAQLQAGRHNLRARLGSHDRKLQLLVRDKLPSLLAGADKVQAFTRALDKILARPPRLFKVDASAIRNAAGSNALFAYALQCVCDRFEPFLRLLDKITSVQRTANLLVLFAPLVDGPDRPLVSQERWRSAIAKAAQIE